MIPTDEKSKQLPASTVPSADTDVQEPDLRSTEDQMNMRGTIPPRVDRQGSKIEDLAGTGDLDTPGG